MTLLLLPANFRLNEFLLTTKLGLLCQILRVDWLMFSDDAVTAAKLLCNVQLIIRKKSGR